MKREKVLIIGLDGATFDIINPLIREGKLPNIASLMKNGMSAPLISTIPPITAPAWTSFMSGKNPGKHGIFGFVKEFHHTYYERPISNGGDIKTSTLWDLASKFQKRMILINIPYTYPPPKINGLVISGMDAPQGKLFTHPPELSEEILGQIGIYKRNYRLNWFTVKNSSLAFYDDLIKNINSEIETEKRIALYLLKKYQWDLFMIVFVATDIMQHMFWKFMDKDHINYNPQLAKRYSHVIFEIYQKIDAIIGELLRDVGEDVTIILTSDHGFGPLQKLFYTNSWLLQNGFLQLKKRNPWKWEIAHPTINRYLARLGLGVVTQYLPGWVRNQCIPMLKIRRVKDWAERIDWSRTKAYGTLIGINVNLKNRELEGIVESGEEYNALLTHITNKLYNLIDPVSGEKVVDRVVRKEDVYRGIYTDEATDIMFIMKGLSYLQRIEKIHPHKLFERDPSMALSGIHAMNGILIMCGSPCKENIRLKNAQIIDIAPTICYLLGLPVPTDMDGRVLTDGIKPTFLQIYPPKSISIDVEKNIVEGYKDAYSQTETKEKEEFLRGLGYLG